MDNQQNDNQIKEKQSLPPQPPANNPASAKPSAPPLHGAAQNAGQAAGSADSDERPRSEDRYALAAQKDANKNFLQYRTSLINTWPVIQQEQGGFTNEIFQDKFHRATLLEEQHALLQTPFESTSREAVRSVLEAIKSERAKIAISKAQNRNNDEVDFLSRLPGGRVDLDAIRCDPQGHLRPAISYWMPFMGALKNRLEALQRQASPFPGCRFDNEISEKDRRLRRHIASLFEHDGALPWSPPATLFKRVDELARQASVKILPVRALSMGVELTSKFASARSRELLEIEKKFSPRPSHENLARILDFAYGSDQDETWEAVALASFETAGVPEHAKVYRKAHDNQMKAFCDWARDQWEILHEGNSLKSTVLEAYENHLDIAKLRRFLPFVAAGDEYPGPRSFTFTVRLMCWIRDKLPRLSNQGRLPWKQKDSRRGHDPYSFLVHLLAREQECPQCGYPLRFAKPKHEHQPSRRAEEIDPKECLGCSQITSWKRTEFAPSFFPRIPLVLESSNRRVPKHEREMTELAATPCPLLCSDDSWFGSIRAAMTHYVCSHPGQHSDEVGLLNGLPSSKVVLNFLNDSDDEDSNEQLLSELLHQYKRLALAPEESILCPKTADELAAEGVSADKTTRCRFGPGMENVIGRIPLERPIYKLPVDMSRATHHAFMQAPNGNIVLAYHLYHMSQQESAALSEYHIASLSLGLGDRRPEIASPPRQSNLVQGDQGNIVFVGGHLSLAELIADQHVQGTWQLGEVFDQLLALLKAAESEKRAYLALPLDRVQLYLRRRSAPQSSAVVLDRIAIAQLRYDPSVLAACPALGVKSLTENTRRLLLEMMVDTLGIVIPELAEEIWRENQDRNVRSKSLTEIGLLLMKYRDFGDRNRYYRHHIDLFYLALQHPDMTTHAFLYFSSVNPYSNAGDIGDSNRFELGPMTCGLVYRMVQYLFYALAVPMQRLGTPLIHLCDETQERLKHLKGYMRPTDEASVRRFAEWTLAGLRPEYDFLLEEACRIFGSKAQIFIGTKHTADSLTKEFLPSLPTIGEIEAALPLEAVKRIAEVFERLHCNNATLTRQEARQLPQQEEIDELIRQKFVSEIEQNDNEDPESLVKTEMQQDPPKKPTPRHAGSLPAEEERRHMQDAENQDGGDGEEGEEEQEQAASPRADEDMLPADLQEDVVMTTNEKQAAAQFAFARHPQAPSTSRAAGALDAEGCFDSPILQSLEAMLGHDGNHEKQVVQEVGQKKLGTRGEAMTSSAPFNPKEVRKTLKIYHYEAAGDGLGSALVGPEAARSATNAAAMGAPGENRVAGGKYDQQVRSIPQELADQRKEEQVQCEQNSKSEQNRSGAEGMHAGGPPSANDGGKTAPVKPLVDRTESDDVAGGGEPEQEDKSSPAIVSSDEPQDPNEVANRLLKKHQPSAPAETSARRNQPDLQMEATATDKPLAPGGLEMADLDDGPPMMRIEGSKGLPPTIPGRGYTEQRAIDHGFDTPSWTGPTPREWLQMGFLAPPAIRLRSMPDLLLSRRSFVAGGGTPLYEEYVAQVRAGARKAYPDLYKEKKWATDEKAFTAALTQSMPDDFPGEQDYRKPLDGLEPRQRSLQELALLVEVADISSQLFEEITRNHREGKPAAAKEDKAKKKAVKEKEKKPQELLASMRAAKDRGRVNPLLGLIEALMKLPGKAVIDWNKIQNEEFWEALQQRSGVPIKLLKPPIEYKLDYAICSRLGLKMANKLAVIGIVYGREETQERLLSLPPKYMKQAVKQFAWAENFTFQDTGSHSYLSQKHYRKYVVEEHLKTKYGVNEEEVVPFIMDFEEELGPPGKDGRLIGLVFTQVNPWLSFSQWPAEASNPVHTEAKRLQKKPKGEKDSKEKPPGKDRKSEQPHPQAEDAENEDDDQGPEESPDQEGADLNHDDHGGDEQIAQQTTHERKRDQKANAKQQLAKLPAGQSAGQQALELQNKKKQASGAGGQISEQPKEKVQSKIFYKKQVGQDGVATGSVTFAIPHAAEEQGGDSGKSSQEKRPSSSGFKQPRSKASSGKSSVKTRQQKKSANEESSENYSTKGNKSKKPSITPKQGSKRPKK